MKLYKNNIKSRAVGIDVNSCPLTIKVGVELMPIRFPSSISALRAFVVTSLAMHELNADSLRLRRLAKSTG